MNVYYDIHVYMPQLSVRFIIYEGKYTKQRAHVLGERAQTYLLCIQNIKY